MVPEVTLIPNVSINIVTKFQVSILKNDEVRGGGYFNPPLRRISWQRGLRGIGLSYTSCTFTSCLIIRTLPNPLLLLHAPC